LGQALPVEAEVAAEAAVEEVVVGAAQPQLAAAD
jgi:hypothetical protein